MPKVKPEKPPAVGVSDALRIAQNANYKASNAIQSTCDFLRSIERPGMTLELVKELAAMLRPQLHAAMVAMGDAPGTDEPE